MPKLTSHDARRRALHRSRHRQGLDTTLGTTIFDAAPVGIIIMSSAGTIMRANEAVQRLLRRTEDELRVVGLSPISHPEDSPETCRLFTELVRAERDFFYQEKRYALPDGSYVSVLLSVSAVRNPDGTMRHTVTMLQDLSEHKHLLDQQAALHAQRQTLVASEAERERLAFLSDVSRALSSSLNHWGRLEQLTRLAVPRLSDWCTAYVLSSRGELRTFSTVAPEHTELASCIADGGCGTLDHGHPVAEVLRTGRPLFADTLTPELLKALASDDEHCAQVRELGVRSVMLLPLTARERTFGVLSLVRLQRSPAYTTDDLLFATELAQRAALAVDNARLYSEAQQALHARDQFISLAAHEIKTPITSMLGYAQLLARRLATSDVSDRERRMVGTLEHQARRLNRLAISLLDLSRLQLGRMDITTLPIELTQLARRVIEEMHALSDTHTFDVELPAQQVVVSGDELRLEQVFYNLLTNAVKYSPQGGAVGVRMRVDGEHVIIEVSDSGIGIPPAVQSSLFTPYFRAANADSSQISGLGLGLYVVKEIVERHGGTVSATSDEGHGSTFTLTLPLLDE